MKLKLAFDYDEKNKAGDEIEITDMMRDEKRFTGNFGVLALLRGWGETWLTITWFFSFYRRYSAKCADETRQKMTNNQIDNLRGVDLARACAEAMGWKPYPDKPTIWKTHEGNWVYIGIPGKPDWRPDKDHNCAAQLRTWAMKKYPTVSWHWSLREGEPVRLNLIEDWFYIRESIMEYGGNECVATCRAFLLLCEVVREKAAG